MTVLPDNIRPEIELLLLCSRTTLQPVAIERIAALVAAPLDFDYLVETAGRQGITQLFYRNLSSNAGGMLSAEKMNQLHLRFQANARQTMMLTGELVKITASFESHSIQSIPFKGPTLAMMLYDNVGLRRFQDVDLLVHRDDLLRARDLLMAEGYTPQFDLEGARGESFLRTQHQLVMIRESDGCIVELHWEISPRYFAFPFPASQLWDRVEMRPLFGRNLMMLSLYDQLLILSAHGAKHNWERLAWICDIAELLDRYGSDIDWTEMFDRAARLGAERMVLLALRLAADLLRATLPQAAIERMPQHPELAGLVSDVLANIGSGEEYNVEVMNRSGFHLRTRERLSDRIRYGLHRATQPTMEDWDTFHLPPALAGLMPLLRPFRLAVKHGRRLLRRFV